MAKERSDYFSSPGLIHTIIENQICEATVATNQRHRQSPASVRGFWPQGEELLLGPAHPELRSRRQAGKQGGK